ncbi:restriction endonuclease subunit S [Vaginella massiliensis]|uniref:restriction endonuclease subunit S n=1 Tax=Vaginella massiliensis TaxID=1816680 RepID=UPI000839A1A6|nr:restriction endonuclease subunit S [Vaginella massiliensis]
MRKYENLTQSEFHWIKEYPSSWKLGRIKNNTYVKARIGWQGLRSDEFILNSDWYCVTGTDFKDGSIDWENCYCVEEDRYNQDKKIQLKIDDLLITKDGTIGKIALIKDLPKKSTLNSGVFVTRPLMKSYNVDYFYWVLSSNVFRDFIDYHKNGSTILHLYQNVFERFVFLIPSFHEQQAIANYLDAKTQAIDKKISLLEQKIETYKKLKRTLINQTITKGLRSLSEVEMKDSGISWIGQIPQHWEVKRLKDVCKSMSSGATPTSGNLSYYEDGTINWLNTGDLNDGIINSTQKKLNNTVFDDYPNLKIQKKGTLVIAMYGATIGKMGLLDIDSTTNQACCCLNLKNDNFNKFHFYQLLNIKQYIISLSVGGTQPNVSQGILSFIEMVVPPKSEQEEIAKYLDHKTATIDAIVINIGKQIDTLKQLRKTLINDVVTGKIKVVE